MKNPILKSVNHKVYGSNDTNSFTLRDHFAGLAMQSVMIGDDYKSVQTPESVAKWSYAMADAMLKERSNEK